MPRLALGGRREKIDYRGGDGGGGGGEVDYLKLYSDTD
jgi:hypothetical protein